MDHVQGMVELLLRGEVERALEEARRHYAESGASEDWSNQAVIKGLNHLYTRLVVAPVHECLRQAAETLKPSQAQALRAALEGRIKKTEEWAQTMAALRRERLARELRAAIRGRRLKEAAQRVCDMTELARGDQDKNAVVGHLASTLGTLDHAQDKVDKLLEAIQSSPSRFGLSPDQVLALAQARDRQYAHLASMALEGREREFTRALSQAIVDLRSSLTLEMAAGEPTEEETAAFFEELHSILRAVWLAERRDGLTDAIALLVEITPRDPRSVGPAVAGEERLFLSLNPRQRLCAVRALRRLGEIPRIPKWFVQFAESDAARPCLISIVEVMGGVGRREFCDFIVRVWRDNSVADPRFSCIDALGRIEQEAAANLLMRRFAQLLQSRPFDPPKRREAEAISTALGRISRSRDIPSPRRNEIVQEALRRVPASDTQMGLRAAMDFFSYKPEELGDDLIVWAAERIVAALWSQDTRHEQARADKGRAALLGFRQQMVDLAVRLGPRAQQPLLKAAEPFSQRFSGAYFALAEILEKIGNQTALPLLKKLVFNAWMASDEAASKYFRETYYDPADGALKPMTRDKVIHALLYAISKACGKPGMAYLVETARQIRAKQLDVPGQESAKLLMDLLLTHGPVVEEEGTGPGELAEGGSASGPAAPDNPFANAPIEEAAQALRARYFRPKARREKKILAIQEIARQRHAEALDLLADHLTDPDPWIQSAAATALQDFAAPGVRESTQRRLGELLIDRLGGKKDEERQAARQLLLRLNPRREPFRTQILRAWEMEPQGALKAELSRLIRASGIHGTAGSGMGQEMPIAAALDVLSGANAEGAASESAEHAKAASIHEARRQFYLARKAWIESGKRDSPPKPPGE